MNRFYHQLIIAFTLLFILPQALNAQQLSEYKERGVIYISTLSFVNGFGHLKYSENSELSNTITTVSIHQIVGYQFGPYLSLGMGLGFEKWKRTSFIPLYADLRVNFLYNRYSPFISADFGYSSKWYESPIPDYQKQVIHGATEGVYFAGGAGVKVMVSRSIAGILAVEYKLQESSLKYSDPYNSYPALTTNREDQTIYQFFGIRAGILF